MAYSDSNYCFVVNDIADNLANIVINCGQGVCGFRLEGYDQVRKIVCFNVGMSAFSWGERITVTLTPVSPYQTQLYIQSSSKLGTEIVASSKNRENVAKLYNAIYPYLRFN